MNNLLSNVTPVIATAEYGSVEVQLHLALDGGDWSTWRPGRFNP